MNKKEIFEAQAAMLNEAADAMRKAHEAGWDIHLLASIVAGPPKRRDALEVRITKEMYLDRLSPIYKGEPQ